MERISGVRQDDDRARPIPLFATRDGEVAEKKAVVAAWAELPQEAALDWDPPEDSDGYLGVDGHSPRRSGAKLLIRIGWRREGVAFLGRWGSDAILAYLEEVTMVNEAFGQFGRLVDGPEDRPPPPSVVAAEKREYAGSETADLKAVVDGLRAEFASVLREVEKARALAEGAGLAAAAATVVASAAGDCVRDCQADVASLPSWEGVENRLKLLVRGPSYVVAANSDTYHRVASCHPLDGPEEHHTRCGWRFGLTRGTTFFDDPPVGKVRCKRRPRGCFGEDT
jgi:hypothetical protein